MSLYLIAAYLILLILLGLVALRRSRLPLGYFLAGRKLGLVGAALTTMASIMSGFVFIGGPALFYEMGFGSVWIIISSSFTGALMAWVLSRPLHQMADQGCLTIPDVLLQRYGSTLLSGMAAGAVVLGVVGYLATQLRALGVLMAAGFDLPVSWAVALAVGVLIFYSVGGGVLASVYSDILQGIWMLGIALLIFWFAAGGDGGFAGTLSRLAEADTEILSPWGRAGGVMAVGWFFLFSVGSLGQPHVVNRFMMIRDLRRLRAFPILLAAGMLVCGLVWLSAGAAVRLEVLEGRVPLEHPDETFSFFLEHLAPAWLVPLAWIGVLAAVMSTADSFVNVGAAALARDLPRALGRESGDQVLLGRIWGLLLFALAACLAYFWTRGVGYLGIFSFGTFAAALVPALALGLNWPSAGRLAAVASLVTGLGLGLSLEWARSVEGFQMSFPPGCLALAASMLVFLILGRVGRTLDQRADTNAREDWNAATE